MVPALTIVTILLFGLASFMPAYAQTTTINVNQTEPCFLNYTAGADIWRNCGLGDDYLDFVLLPWEWVTGGNFSLVIVSLITTFSYIKYHKVVYPIFIGVMFLPVSFFIFPQTFLTWAILMAGVTIGILIWYIYIKQTKEY